MHPKPMHANYASQAVHPKSCSEIGRRKKSRRIRGLRVRARGNGTRKDLHSARIWASLTSLPIRGRCSQTVDLLLLGFLLKTFP